MKKTLTYVTGAVGLMLAACQPSAQKASEGGLLHIDVAGAMEVLTELKVSDLETHVRYVPLETNDSCLIGRNPEIKVLDKQILVKSGNDLYGFDKETGRFLNSIGHVGDDPEGYSQGGLPIYNDYNGLLYFVRQPDQLQKFDLQGNYRGKDIVPTPPAMPTDYAFIDTLTVGCYNNIGQQNTHNRSLAFFTETGELTDTVNSLLPALPPMEITDIARIDVKKFGNMGAIFTRFQNGTASTSIAGVPLLWKTGGKLRFKEIFSDTLYNIARPGSIMPYAVLETGKWHFPAEARQETSGSGNKLLPTIVLENDSVIFFQCVRGLYEDEPEVLNGIYDKTTHTVHMAKELQGIVDDVNGFLPFHPNTCGTQGEFAQIVEASEVLEWLDEHPEAKDNPVFTSLLHLNEENNPIVILVE